MKYMSNIYQLESLRQRQLQPQRNGKMDVGFQFRQMETHDWLQHPIFLEGEARHQLPKIGIVLHLSALLLYSDDFEPISGLSCYDFVTRDHSMRGFRGLWWMVEVGCSTYYYKYLQHLKHFRCIRSRMSQGCSLVYFVGCLILL